MAEKEEDVLSIAREQFKSAHDASLENRELAVDDLDFLNGEQWPHDVLDNRNSSGRPCLVINKLPSFIDQIIGDQRQNRPAIKVRPVDSDADVETAEILTGHIRNIDQISQADVARDTAFECAVACGEGYYRVVAEYTDDDIFEQDIKIKRIANPFDVYYYPYNELREFDCSDAKSVFITEWMLKEDFEKNWPGKYPVDIEKPPENRKHWVEKDRVRVGEWFRKVPTTKTIWKMADGQVWDSSRLDDQGIPTTREKLEADGLEIVAERKVKTHKILWYRITCDEILEGPEEWPGKYFPIIPVWGKEYNIEGKRTLRGLIRHSKDPQRLYNYSRSHYAEVVALAPKAPYTLTPDMVDGHESRWEEAHRENFPYLLFNIDSKAPGLTPQREIPNVQHTGIKDQILIADQELHDTSGLQPPSLGKPSQERSGRAIIARQREGDVATFAYIDNLARSMTYEGKVLIDLIPKVYNTERTLRLLGEDGSVKTVMVQPGAQREQKGREQIYDITVGKYDIAVTVGPSYTTQRQEAAESMLNFIGVFKDAAPIIGDLIAKNMDWPGAQEIADRLKKLLPPGLAEQEPDEAGTQPPGGMPPEGMGTSPEQAMAETMNEAELEMADVKLDTEKVKLKQEKAKLKGIELDNEKTRVEIKAAKRPKAQTPSAARKT